MKTLQQIQEQNHESLDEGSLRTVSGVVIVGKIKTIEKPTTELLEGIVDKIIVSPVIGETREGKETQRGHIFNIKFKLPIVNDGIEILSFRLI